MKKQKKTQKPLSQEEKMIENNLKKANYPPKDDIYNRSDEEKEIDPEDTSTKKEKNKNYSTGTWNDKDFEKERKKSDLDVPGSELDDAEENIGNEDEENNYYSEADN